MDEPDIIEDLYGVYLLYSLNDKYLGRTYIGYTVNPIRRISQHNKGCHAGGAKRTSKRGPWKMVLMIHGFPNSVAALRFEWAWQNPENSLRLQHISNKKKMSKESKIQYNIRILCEMLSVGPWKRMPLTIQWLEMEFYQEFPSGKLPPFHMPICYGPIQRGKLSPSKTSQNRKTDNRKSTMISVNSNENIFCNICDKEIFDNNIVCLNTECKFVSHMLCLADTFLENDEYTEYIPIEGECPHCKVKLLWGDLMKELKKLDHSDNVDIDRYVESNESTECNTSSDELE